MFNNWLVKDTEPSVLIISDTFNFISDVLNMTRMYFKISSSFWVGVLGLEQRSNFNL